MKISGFTFVKNAVKFGYPVTESIRSILPIVDEMIVCLGDSEDETAKLIESIGSDKIKIIHSVWDANLREGGRVLAIETDKAMDATASDSDWLFYLQADEVVHEQYYSTIINAMQRYRNNERVEGLLFHYHHFYGSYKYIGDGRKWYSKEIRIIRNNKNIRSFRDAQGFRWKDNRKLNVKLIDAYIYHYGWVRNPKIMFKKFKDFERHWTNEEQYNNWEKELEKKTDKFDYTDVDTVALFKGTHPEVMEELLNKEDWNFEIDIRKKKFKSIRDRLLYFIWRRSGMRILEYSNYRKI